METQVAQVQQDLVVYQVSQEEPVYLELLALPVYKAVLVQQEAPVFQDNLD